MGEASMSFHRLVRCLLLPALSATSPLRSLAQERVIPKSQLLALFRDSLQASKLRVIAGGRTETITAAASAWRLRPGQFITAAAGSVVTPATPFPQPIKGDLLALPFRYLATNAAGTATLYLRPTVEIKGGGLRYAGAARGFRGAFLLGLEDSLQYAESHVLAPGIRFAVTADADSVQPSAIAVTHTNLPFEEIVVLVAAAPTDSVRVHIRPQFNPEGVDLWLPIQRPALTLRPSPERVQGFGLETTTLSIGRGGGAPPEGRAVVLTADRGNPEPKKVRLSDAGTAFARIRSAGLGTAVIRAESPPYAPAEARVEFVFPLAFLVAALLGGSLGGVVRALQGQPPETRRLFVTF